MLVSLTLAQVVGHHTWYPFELVGGESHYRIFKMSCLRAHFPGLEPGSLPYTLVALSRLCSFFVFEVTLLYVSVLRKCTLAFKDDRANCFWASRLRTSFMSQCHATSCISARAKETFLQRVGLVSVLLSWKWLYSHRCQVTLFFLYKNRLLHLFPWFSENFKKIWPWEVIYFFSFSTKKGTNLRLYDKQLFLQNVIFTKWNDTNYKYLLNKLV